MNVHTNLIKCYENFKEKILYVFNKLNIQFFLIDCMKSLAVDFKRHGTVELSFNFNRAF